MPVPAPTPLPVAIYLRVSTEEQARAGYSLQEQRAECQQKARHLAAEHERRVGGPVDLQLAEFVDDFGGDVAERPALEALREYVRTRRPVWVVCMDPDRFSRSLKLQLILADEMEARGARLAFVQQEYDPADLMSRAFFQFRGLMSELEKAKILERTARGKRGKIRAGGRPNGAAPFGYIHLKESDRLDIYEPEALWVRRIFHWVAHEGLSIHQVAARLNELGVPRKRGGVRWHRSVVAELVENPAYHGAMRCNRKDFRGLGAVRRLPPGMRQPLSARIRPPSEWLSVPVPAIIDRALWEQAGAAVRATARRGGRRDTGLLSLLVRCGLCGAPMAYARHTSGRCYLRCRNRYAPGAPRCPNPHQRAERVEAQVWALLAQRAALPAPVPETAAQAAELQRLRAGLQAEHRLQAVTLQRSGALAAQVVDLVLAESSRRAAEIGRAISDLEQRIARGQDQGPPPSPRDLDRLSPAERRALVLRVVDRVTVSAAGQVSVTFHNPKAQFADEMEDFAQLPAKDGNRYIPLIT